MRVGLTPAGGAAYRTLRVAVGAFNEHLLTGISEDDQAQLRDLLDRLGANAGEAVPAPSGERRDT